MSHGEAVEKELDRLISKRASQDRRPDRDEREELWKASVRRSNATRQEEMRQAWAAFHSGQAASLRHTLEVLITHHTTQAEKYTHQPNANAKGAT